MDTKAVGMWSFYVGVVLALANVFFNLGAWVTQVLIVLGVLVGFFHPIRDDFLTFGIAYLVLAAAANSADALVGIGPYISAITAAVVQFLGPVVLVAFMFWGFPYLITMKKKPG